MTTRPDEFAAWSGPRWDGSPPEGQPRDHTPATAYIRRVYDGAVRGVTIPAWFSAFRQHLMPDEWTDSHFWWSDGNASCDCMRAHDFGEKRKTPCGAEAYEARIVSSDGVLLYSDWACDT